jgi:fatty-acyl-CoA synthase
MNSLTAQEIKEPSPREWEEQTVGFALQNCARRLGDRDFLIFRERRMSAKQLAQEVEHLALGLLELGIQKGDNVAVWLPNLPEMCVAELAIARIGAAMMAINTRYKASELEYVLRQSDSRALIMMPQFLTQDFLAVLRDVIPEYQDFRPGELNAKATPLLKNLIMVGDAQPGMFAYSDVQSMGRERLPELQQREKEIAPDDIVLLQYTSGTTAFPKAAMLAHGQVLRNAAQMAVRTGINESDRVLSAMPMFHVGGSVCALLGALTMRYALYMGPVFDAGKTIETIETEQITTYIGLESMFIALRAHEDFSRRSRASLKKGWTAGTSSILRMVADEVGIEYICPLFGLSEGSPNVCICDWRDPIEKRITTMGRPQPGVEIKIIDPATEESVASGQRGEICFRGYNVMKGYYKKPDETARIIDKDGWLHTGDVGFLDQDGFITWTGRLKDVIRVGGENISAVEVENFLSGHPSVQAAVVIGVPDDRLGEVCMAFIQVAPNAELSEDEVIAYCKGRISGFKIPRTIRFVREFEMTGSGKIMKFAMRRKVLQELGYPETS